MFRGIFSNKEAQAAEAAKSAAASRQANAPTRPPNAVQPPGVPGGVMPTIPTFQPTVHHAASPSSRPDPAALAQARKARQAGLAAAAFGTPQPPTHSPAQPQRPSHSTSSSYPSPPTGFGGPPGGFGGDQPMGSGDSGGGMGGGGGDFDMFGGLDVKGPDTVAPSFPTSSSFTSAPTHSSSSYPSDPELQTDSSLLSALNSTDDASSGFAFISDDSAAPPTDDASSGFSFISSTDESQPTYDDPSASAFPSYGLPSPSEMPHATSGDPLTAAKQHIDHALSAFWVEWRGLSASESGLKAEEVQLQLSIRQNSAAVKETEDKQGAAVMAEEYEKADSYNAELDRLKAAIQSAQERLKGVRAEVDGKEQQKARAAQSILQVLADSTAQFESLSQGKAGELSTFVSTQVGSLKETDAAVSADLQRVEESLSHTQGELDAIQHEDEALGASLRQETQPYVDEKERLLEDEHRLENELAELKRQVAAKEKEINANKEKLKSADRAVEVVRAKNSAQRVAIQQKRAKVDDLRSRDVNEKRQIERRRTQLEEEIAENKRREKEYRLTLHDVASQLAHAQYLSTLIQAESKQREAFHTTLRTAEEQIASLQHTLDSHDENLAKARAELLLLEQQLDGHTKNIQHIATKIPAMETEKNAAVAARDFKKAATASKEIKTLQQSKTDSEAALEELKAKVDKNSAELGGADEKKAEIEREMKRLEEETDRKRMIFLLNRVARLQRRQTTASELQQKASTAGRGGEGLDHLQKEVESVAVELQWTQVEIRELQNKYGWKDGDVQPTGAEAEVEEEEEAEVLSHVDDPSPFDSIRGTLAPNGLPSAAALGVPVIAPRKSSSVSFFASPHPPTPADLASLRQSLTDAQSRLSAYEGKLAEALEGEDYERADELNASISKEKEVVEALEAKVAQAEKAMKEAGRNEEAERKDGGDAGAGGVSGAGGGGGGGGGGDVVDFEEFAEEG